MKRYLSVLLVVAATAAADMVITGTEVVGCEVLNGDTSVVRLKLPSGGVRVLRTQDVYEIKIADQVRADQFAVALPYTRVTYDAQADSIAQAEAARRSSLDATGERRDPVGARHVMVGGGLGFTSYRVSDITNSVFALSPSLSLFVTRGLGLGVEVSVNSVSVGNARVSSSVFGPKVTAALGPRGSTGYFLAEAGIGLMGGTGSSGGDRLWFGGGYLPVVGRNLGLPITLRVNMDHVGESRLTTVQIGWGLCGLL